MGKMNFITFILGFIKFILGSIVIIIVEHLLLKVLDTVFGLQWRQSKPVVWFRKYRLVIVLIVLVVVVVLLWDYMYPPE